MERNNIVKLFNENQKLFTEFKTNQALKNNLIP